MSERKDSNSAIEENDHNNEPQESKTHAEGLSRRTFLGVGSAGLATRCIETIHGSLRVCYAERKSLPKREMPSFCMRK